MSAQEPEQNKVIHEVDGIQEYDNKLPNWWLYTLYGSILFGAGYWFHYQTSGFGDLPRAEYQIEMDKAASVEAARIKAAGVLTPEALVSLSKDKGTVEQGKAVFAATCVACHRADGGGVVGPNLDPWRGAGQDLEDDHDRRARQGNACVGTAARCGSHSRRHGVRHQPSGYQRLERQGPTGRPRHPDDAVM